MGLRVFEGWRGKKGLEGDIELGVCFGEKHRTIGRNLYLIDFAGEISKKSVQFLFWKLDNWTISGHYSYFST